MKICIVGTGTMGHGIAQVFAQAGHEVLLKVWSAGYNESGY